MLDAELIALSGVLPLEDYLVMNRLSPSTTSISKNPRYVHLFILFGYKQSVIPRPRTELHLSSIKFIFDKDHGQYVSGTGAARSSQVTQNNPLS